jgi:glucose/arabinose dehydrogenase
MAVAPDGTLFVGTLSDRVYAVTPGRKVHTLAAHLNAPNGVAYQDGSLYIAETGRLSRVSKVLEKLESSPTPEILNHRLPDKRHHGNRVLRFGPDRRLYIGIGAPCNVGENPDPFASLSRFSPDFQRLEIYARGVRNTMGFDWDPRDGCLWFTDNGRDLLGDDLPPEELNRAPRAGLHFGFPYYHGNNDPDPEYGAKAPAGLSCTPPAGRMQAHMAPLGMRFYRGQQFPARYRNCIVVATHGSWNRTTPVGYNLMLARTDAQGQAQLEVFARGWLQGRKVTGRPVDVQELPDGSMAISDDFMGAVYRLSYSN